MTCNSLVIIILSGALITASRLGPLEFMIVHVQTLNNFQKFQKILDTRISCYGCIISVEQYTMSVSFDVE